MIFVKHIKTGLWLKHKQSVGWRKNTERDPGNIIAHNYIGVEDVEKARMFDSISSAKRALREYTEKGVIFPHNEYKFYTPIVLKLKEVK